MQGVIKLTNESKINPKKSSHHLVRRGILGSSYLTVRVSQKLGAQISKKLLACRKKRRNTYSGCSTEHFFLLQLLNGVLEEISDVVLSLLTLVVGNHHHDTDGILFQEILSGL